MNIQKYLLCQQYYHQEERGRGIKICGRSKDKKRETVKRQGKSRDKKKERKGHGRCRDKKKEGENKKIQEE